MSEREKWFNDRIGKLVYRNKTTCKCPTCDGVYQAGVLIFDQMHANYLEMCEAEYNIEGTPLRYFDTVEERDKFESEI